MEKTLFSQQVYDGGFIQVTEDRVLLPSGREGKRSVVRHKGGAAVVALDHQTRVALVRQYCYRYATDREMIELPAGKLEDNEPPMEAAVRELEEEAGLTAESWQAFGQIVPTCGYCDEIIYLFLATRLQEVEQKLDEDEYLSLFWLPLDQAVAMVLSGEIDDAKTVSGLLRAWLALMPR